MTIPRCPFKDIPHDDTLDCDLGTCPIYFGHVLAGKTTQGVCANKNVMEYAKEQQAWEENQRYMEACERGKLDV